MASEMELEILQAEQWSQLLLGKFIHPDTNIVCQDEVQEGLLLAIEACTDGNLRSAGAFFAR
jgi:hypothetical protein